jgi:hypothetical protein
MSDIEDETVTPARLGSKTHLVCAVFIDQGQLYTHITGIFLVRFSKGNWYVMICYFYDFKSANAVPMKSRSASEWLKAYEHMHQELTSRGFKPDSKLWTMKPPQHCNFFMTKNDVEYQLVPPHCHRRNTDERAIHTFKEHFVSGLASVDPDFPLHLWGRLLPQAEMTLNLLRKSRQHPHLTAAVHYHGMVDYNKTDFAPPG